MGIDFTVLKPFGEMYGNCFCIPHIESVGSGERCSCAVLPETAFSCQFFSLLHIYTQEFSSLCPTLCNPMGCSTPDLPVLHYLPEFAQVCIHWIGNTIQPSGPLMAPSPSALNLSQYRGLFHWVSCSHQMTTILEFQLQHQSFHQVFRVDFPQD